MRIESTLRFARVAVMWSQQHRRHDHGDGEEGD